jgi:hypothetical protein
MRTAPVRTRIREHRPVLERFWEKVLKTDGCWIWQGTMRDDGYGLFSVTGVSFRAHRIAYEIEVDSIPEGMTLDHTCHNADPNCIAGSKCPHRRCVNPAHLEPATLEENTERGKRGDLFRRRTHCRRGHPRIEANIYRPPNAPNMPHCIPCRRIYDARRRRQPWSS